MIELVSVMTERQEEKNMYFIVKKNVVIEKDMTEKNVIVKNVIIYEFVTLCNCHQYRNNDILIL